MEEMTGDREQHGDELRLLRTKLVDGFNQVVIGDLLDDLLQEGVMNQSEVEYINEKSSVSKEKCRIMIDMVIKKGDHSCNLLLQKVLERDPCLSQKLNLTETGKMIHTMNFKEDYQIILKTEGSRMYPVLPHEGRKRLALIICNIQFNTLPERRGAEYDVKGMCKLLENLGYQVLLLTNITSKTMLEKMRTFAAREEHADSDSTFIVLMSHGKRDGICGINSEIITDQNGENEMTDFLKIDDVFNTFNNVNCAKLRDKPKIIIIQACRGEEHGRVWTTDSATKSANHHLESDAMVQKESDFICFYSTTPDTVSYRDPRKGSLFILQLIECMNNSAHCSSLEDIFREVQFSFKDKQQMPTQERKTIMKKIYLFPGY
ncbi:caspase-1-A-like [Pelodytes ibericus]